MTNSALAVTGGVFTVTLDFGDQFAGPNRWLEIGVRSNGIGVFTILNPRQPLTPAPYAMYATAAGVANGVSASTIIQGQGLNVGSETI